MIFAGVLALLASSTTVTALSQSLLTANDRIAGSPGHLRVSAVVNEEQPPYNAKIECWELEAPFHDYPTIGASIPLSVSNLTYVTLPAGSTEGLHHPPHPMFFILLAGIAHVELPADPQSDGLWVVECVNPIIIAIDTLGIGHNTTYLGDKPAIALQAPFKDGIVPDHKVIASGACSTLRER